MTPVRHSALMVTALFVLSACATDRGGDVSSATAQHRPDSAASTVTFKATDYAFEGPDTVSSGPTALEVVNRGQEPHHIQVIQLPPGKTARDFGAALETSHGLPVWSKFVGGPNAIVPGERATALVNLVPGNYLLICLIPDQAGMPHLARGMQKNFTVTASSGRRPAHPQETNAIAEVDFGFSMERPMTAGRHIMKVTNRGTQPHEVVVVQLAEGRSVREFGQAFEPGASGPPPGKPIGGIVGLDPGSEGYFLVDLEPGHYGLICFFPDLETGAPHFMKGMTMDFTVTASQP